MAKDFYNLSVGECLKSLKTTKDGLPPKNRDQLLKENGFNELKGTPKQPVIILFLKQFKDVMTIVLLVAAIISMFTSVFSHATSELIDGFIILGIVFFNAFIGFWQEQKAQKSMEELKKLTQPEAKILSGGIVQKISSKNLVVGDILVLEAGDIVPADARLIESVALKCDESALSGESVAALKDHKALLPHGASLADRVNMVFSGSVVTSGRGLAVCTATGQSTEIGKIAK
ncbi:MAG: HAD-IC family P-type ATPase, partial [Clostridia bacterium]|nr:HAD-IC family P-type ATPase [Clostridia bacterium]